jgi:redox-sensitive bicupin YhaK (pirin superfamily)
VSDLDPHPSVAVCGGDTVDGPVWESLDGRDVVLGGTRAKGTDGLTVSRTLPNRTRRMVGAWCFVDHFGPSDGEGMQVAPHPHTGLQTVTWLLDGAVLHRDSLANTQLIQPGQLNLMTAGRAIAHAETSPARGPLHGVQLWVALPDSARGGPPRFEHLDQLPTLANGAGQVRVLAGELGGVASPARVYCPLVGAEVSLRGRDCTLPLDRDFEYAVLPLTGPIEVDGVPAPAGPLLYLGRGRDRLRLGAAGPAKALLLGGEPFTERIVMWWNFIGRSHDEIVADREDWMAGRRFGPVVGYDGEALPAPPMPSTPLLPRGRVP